METKLSQWAEALAEKHGVILRFEESIAEQVPAYKYEIGDQAFVVLNESVPVERLNFALAHEIAHILLNHTDEVAPDEEQEANILASEILLPDNDFMVDAHRPLRVLKALYPHASFEVLARRKIQFVPAVMTIVDNGLLTYRLQSAEFAAPPSPVTDEWNVINEAFSQREDVTVSRNNLDMCATFIDSGHGIARVILFTKAEDFI